MDNESTVRRYPGRARTTSERGKTAQAILEAEKQEKFFRSLISAPKKEITRKKKNAKRFSSLLPGVTRKRRMRLNKMAGLKRNTSRVVKSMSRRKAARERVMREHRMPKRLSTVNENYSENVNDLSKLMGKAGLKGGRRRASRKNRWWFF